jgi:uncharacterized protein YqgV (UPF0045/DUF77 family)
MNTNQNGMAVALKSIESNVNVGMDEVVSVFVSKYETNLFDTKDQLQSQIKADKREADDLEKGLIASVKRSDYEATVPHLGLTFTVDGVTVNWSDDSYRTRGKSIVIAIKMADRGDRDNHSAYTKSMFVPINQIDLDEKARLTALIADLEGKLLEVMGNIKQVGRKERQIRGKIAEMKLGQCGMAALLQNEELLKLVG